MDYDNLKLKSGIEIKEFDTSNEETEYLVTYKEKYWKISQYMYDIMMLIDGQNSLKDIAAKMSQKLGAEITEENIKNAVDKFPVQRGLIEGTEDSSGSKSVGIGRLLWMKIPILKASFIKRLKFLTFMFKPSVFKAMWIFIIACIAFGAYKTKINLNSFRFDNVNYLYVMIIMGIGTWIHEFGHSTACLRYNLVPAKIGFAFYFTFPVLYSDVSCSWRLKRRQRVLVDIGGVYFELIYLSLLFITGTIFNINVFMFTAVIGFLAMQSNLNPIIKMDAYWVISDLLGVPNLHAVSSQFMNNGIIKLLGGKPKTTIDIAKKEKFFFAAYSIIFNVFMYVMLFFLIKYSIQIPNAVKDSFIKVLSMPNKTSWDFVYTVLNNLLFLITIVLVLRSIYYMSKALIMMLINIAKAVWEVKFKATEIEM
jgi:putative peptide zinc metalloprotease protein